MSKVYPFLGRVLPRMARLDWRVVDGLPMIHVTPRTSLGRHCEDCRNMHLFVGVVFRIPHVTSGDIAYTVESGSVVASRELEVELQGLRVFCVV